VLLRIGGGSCFTEPFIADRQELAFPLAVGLEAAAAVVAGIVDDLVPPAIACCPAVLHHDRLSILLGCWDLCYSLAVLCRIA
jgi:hypothetical protein